MGSAGDPVPVAVALGSNLGDREANLRAAIAALTSALDSVRVSRFHDTAPVGAGEQPRFLNAAAIGLTRRAADDLLSELLEIENRLGRTRPFRWAPRTIDLDLILFGDRVISTPSLVVPHPRFRERGFVLAPLADVAGEWVDPVTGKSVTELLSALRGDPTANTIR